MSTLEPTDCLIVSILCKHCVSITYQYIEPTLKTEKVTFLFLENPSHLKELTHKMQQRLQRVNTRVRKTEDKSVHTFCPHGKNTRHNIYLSHKKWPPITPEYSDCRKIELQGQIKWKKHKKLTLSKIDFLSSVIVIGMD